MQCELAYSVYYESGVSLPHLGVGEAALLVGACRGDGDVLIPQRSLQRGRLKVCQMPYFKSWALDCRPYSHGISRGRKQEANSRA